MGRGGKQKNATNGATVPPTRSQKVDVLDEEEGRRIFDMSSRTGISENDFPPRESGKREGFYKVTVPYLLNSISAVFSRRAQIHEERNYKDDVLHKVGGPAIVRNVSDVDGSALATAANWEFSDLVVEEWWVDGKLHREDGPALINRRGGEEWRKNGKLHRVGGPAVKDGSREEWWVDGKRHREDGPARIVEGSIEEWWVDGEPVKIIQTSTNYAESTRTGVSWPTGVTTRYTRYKDGQPLLHRTDGPAVENNEKGRNEWWVDGKQLNLFEIVALKIKNRFGSGQ